MALFHPALFWLSNLFGGGTWTRILPDPFIGVAMAIMFVLMALRFAGRNRIKAHDRQWLSQWRKVINSNEKKAYPPLASTTAARSFYSGFSVVTVMLLSGG